MALPAETAIGTVALTVSDLERSAAWYAEALGLAPTDASSTVDGSAAGLGLGGVDGTPLLSLTGDAEAATLRRGDTGLFHFAMLLPARRDLAGALVRLARAGVRLSGASDHLVSEALYLDDPDGNGIEIYWDRPRADWPVDASGALQMATLPLDLDGLVGELSSEADVPTGPVPSGTRIGHVHLQVAELDEIERFYAGVLGFDVVVRGYPGALFISAGGYHHHIGLNTWNSRGGHPAVQPAVGLRGFEVRLGSEAAVTAVRSRVSDAGLAHEVADGGFTVTDPSGNRVLLRA